MTTEYYKAGTRVRITFEGTLESEQESGDDSFTIKGEREGDWLYIEAQLGIENYIEVLADPLPTTPGLYGHRDAVTTTGSPTILSLLRTGQWIDLTNSSATTEVARGIAEAWHEHGYLVPIGIIQ